MFAINDANRVWSWGQNNQGSLGDLTTDNKSSPVSVVGEHTFLMIGGSNNQMYGLKPNGEVWNCGVGNSGQLGNNAIDHHSSPVAVIGSHTFTYISAGANGDCFALKEDGSCWSWGFGSNGILGNNSTLNRSSPVSVVGNHAFVKTNAGTQHAMGLKGNGEMWTWGRGSSGRLGDNTTINKSSPVSVVGAHAFIDLGNSDSASFGLKANGEVWSWGFNLGSGVLGDNTQTSRSSPVSVVGAHAFTAISKNGGSHMVALKADGSAWCWGTGSSGQLGDNTATNKSSPVSVVGNHTFIQVGALRNTSYGLKANGELWSWGSSFNGELGDNTTTNKSSPIQVVGPFVFTALPGTLLSNDIVEADTVNVSDSISVEDTSEQLADSINIGDSIITENTGFAEGNPNVIVSDSIVTEDTFEDLADSIQISDSIIVNNPNNEAEFASSVISVNPIIFVTDTDPAKIVEVDVSDPENPVHTVTTLVGAKNAKDVAVNTQTGFLFVACADGIVVKVDINNFSTQTIIDLSDTDDLLNIDTLPLQALTYTSTENTTGELYVIDERESELGDFRLDVLSFVTEFADLQGNAIEGQNMDADLRVLQTVSSGFMNSDFKCLDDEVDPLSPINPIDQITPIKRTDFDVKINGTSLDSVDLLLDSIRITHTVGEKSTAEFTLSRLHDRLDTDLAGNSSQITNQNSVTITIQGKTEFTGKVSQIDARYNETDEVVVVTARGDEKTNKYNNITMSLPSLNSRLSLYDILIENPTIYNPFIDPTEENPLKFQGIKVNLGQKRTQSYSRYTVFDSFGSTANKIQNGTFVPRQNWTYFWGPTVKKFGDIQLGETSAITFLYIGTSLAPVTEDLWQLTNAKHRRQRQYDDIITELGEYTVGVAPFREISVRNGAFVPKFHWVDANSSLDSVIESGYNFEEFAKTVADLEYQKLLNINGQILPETSANIVTTIDSYYYHDVNLLTRVNIDNTTQGGIYKNSNGFPISVKNISIDSNSMKVTIGGDNLKSTAELEQINGMFPDEDDEEFNTPGQTISIAGKTNMKNKLAVQ